MGFAAQPIAARAPLTLRTTSEILVSHKDRYYLTLRLQNKWFDGGRRQGSEKGCGPCWNFKYKAAAFTVPRRRDSEAVSRPRHREKLPSVRPLYPSLFLRLCIISPTHPILAFKVAGLTAFSTFFHSPFCFCLFPSYVCVRSMWQEARCM